MDSFLAAPPESYPPQRLLTRIFKKSRKKTAQKLSTTKTFVKDFRKINKNPGRCGFSRNTKTFPKDFQKITRPEGALGPGPMLPGHPVILSIFSKEYKRSGEVRDAPRHLYNFRDFPKDFLCVRYKRAPTSRPGATSAKLLAPLRKPEGNPKMGPLIATGHRARKTASAPKKT